MLTWLFRLLSDRQVKKWYAKRGEFFGELVGMIPIGGRTNGFGKAFKKWRTWETEYLRRGYRALSVDAFVNAGYWNHMLDGLGVRRKNGEAPVSHAAIYKRKYIDQKQPALLSAESRDGVVIGTYARQTTEEE